MQGRVQLSNALRLLPSLWHVVYVTSTGKKDADFESYFSELCEISLAGDRNDAVAQSDVVITATPGGGPLFDVGAVRPGTHLNCVGADTKGKRELPLGLLERSRLFVDDQAQARQIGETQWAPEVPCTELGDLLNGTTRFAREPSDVTVFDMTGLALQDLTVASMLHRRATTARIGNSIAWPW